MRVMVRILVAAAGLALGAAGAREVRAAERAAHVRVFPAGEPPTVAVTLSSRGRVIARQQEGSAITIFDGYSSRQLIVPENALGRVFESRSGQLWSVYAEGLLLFQRGVWTQLPVPEIRLEQGRIFRQTRPISIVPAEVNRAFYLLSDRLMQFDAATGRSTLVKAAAETGLGTFTEMVESFDGGLLISGANGAGRLAGPMRHITTASPWQEFALGPNSPVENLQRPSSLRDGSVMAIGFDRNNPALRYLLRSGEDDWTRETIAGEKIRAAWTGWGDTRWGMSYGGLFRFTSQNPLAWAREGGAETCYDAAPQTNGVFWLATSSGLARYAPPLWMPPAEITALGAAETPALATCQGDGGLWIATGAGLVRVNEGRAERFAWPPDFEDADVLPSVDLLQQTPSGAVVIAAGARTLLFDPGTGAFSRLGGRGARAFGIFNDGSVAIRSVEENGAARVDRFDGEEMTTAVALLADVGVPTEAVFMRESRVGDLWFGGAFGLARYHPGDAKAESFGAAQGILPERIQCLAEVGEDRIWAGGVDAIFEFRGVRWERIRTGLERVRSIVRGRDGSIWVAASDGLHQYVNDAWITHADEEGLPSLVVHDVAQDRRGRVWAATSRGAVEYFPESDPDEPRTFAPVVMESDGEDGANVLVRFSGIDKWEYTSANRLLYAYRLDEGAWSPFTNAAVVAFQNLGSGQHFIQARAMDRNGNRDPSVATAEFAVALPWSRDPRLISVAVLGVLAVAFFAGLAVNRHWRLKRSYAEVERQVAERTAQLEKANQELLHSQKMRALGTLAAGIAHDFNNILSVIKGSAQIIENNPGDREKVMTRVNRIQTVVDQGAGIVRSMLGLGKVGDEVACDPAELLDETIRLVADRFPPEVRIRQERSATSVSFSCSKGVIHQILLNLILNAVDASEGQGEIVLRARVAAPSEPGVTLAPSDAARYLAIDVIDHGIGIAAESLPRIFEPFYTTKGFSSRRGTGLGLSMVYELAKGLGYGLAVKSKPGKGSVFTLLAPLP
jgi:signal transduction histidine kinase